MNKKATFYAGIRPVNDARVVFVCFTKKLDSPDKAILKPNIFSVARKKGFHHIHAAGLFGANRR